MNIDPKFARRNIQKYEWDCGVAVVAFLLRRAGQRVSYAKLMKDLDASAKNGTDLVKIVAFLKSYPEFEIKIGDNWGFDDLTRELAKERVLLVAYQNWDGPKDVGKPDYGHYGIVYKIKDDKISIFDPGTSTGLTEFKRDEFEKRWYEDDLGVHYFRWAASVRIL
ncbi:MAG TPA: cysteine peptidase family C39 domain-containing protein [Patescibacteria group bacterium]|nr:cysteine peptidase family C39 domain-containing protein [Patescibacteria group bacterium]